MAMRGFGEQLSGLAVDRRSTFVRLVTLYLAGMLACRTMTGVAKYAILLHAFYELNKFYEFYEGERHAQKNGHAHFTNPYSLS